MATEITIEIFEEMLAKFEEQSLPQPGVIVVHPHTLKLVCKEYGIDPSTLTTYKGIKISDEY
jgi:hypothetical protein